MALKFMLFPLLFALLAFNFSILLANGDSPVIHVIHAAGGRSSPQISLRIKAGGKLEGSAVLSNGQDYQITVNLNEDVYFASAVYGSEFTSFHAYEPARDKGQAAIYWKADERGFSISYDNINYKSVSPWESD